MEFGYWTKRRTMKYVYCLSALFTALILAAWLAAMATASAAGPPRSSPSCGDTIRKADGKPWRCTFGEEFSGTSLNRTRWIAATTTLTGLRGNGDCWVDTPNNIAVADGVLRLTTRKEGAPFTCTMRDGTTYEAQYTSGSVTTYGKFSQTYGRWDIRARFPHVTTVGSQGILWMTPPQGTYGAGALSGEIDIAEFYSKYPDRVIPFVHYNLSSADSTITNNYCLVTNPWDFHVYSAVWVPGRITISIDGKVCVDHVVHPAAPLVSPQPFDKPFVTNLTQTLGVGTNSLDANTPMPLTTEIDWVHVWS